MVRRKAGATPALRALAAAGVPHEVREYHHDPRVADFGAEAAEALGADPTRVLKTLVASVDGALTVAVVPVAGTLDLKALASAVDGKRAEMADARAAQRATGYVVGGISPLGQRTALPTVVDISALERDTVLVSAGKRGVDVELAPADLVTLTGAIVAPVGRP